MTLRAIPATPPTLEDIDFPRELYGEIGIEQGGFVIGGPTNSGKSTTFAACIRRILEGKTNLTGNILTYEAPIEYLYDDIDSPCCLISQQEIGTNLRSFQDGVRNAMRRNPTLNVIGELRDNETIAASIEAANTGHPFYATAHAKSAPQIIRRLVQRFPPEHQHQAFTDVVQSCRILMTQSLVPSTDGRRVCLRDWIILTDEIIEGAMAAGLHNHVGFLKGEQRKRHRARPMIDSIREARDAGKLGDDMTARLLKKYDYDAHELEEAA